MIRWFVSLLLCLAAGLALAQTVAAPKHRIAIQINEEDPKKWNSVLGSINNIRADLGKPAVAITVVAIGPGLGMLTADSLVANRVEDALAEGVRFVACGNSMAAMKLEADDLLKGVAVERAGYVSLMRLQEAGWTYLRP